VSTGVTGGSTSPIEGTSGSADQPAAWSGQREGPLVEVRNLVKYFPITSGLLRRKIGDVHAVDDVTFDVRGGEVLALVGESGCGKTTLGRLLLRLLPPTSGAVSIRRRQSFAEITSDAEFRRVVRVVFQNPDSSLNPTKRVAAILERPLAIQGVPRPARRARVRELLEAVRLDAGYLRRLPRALSGGEKQRVAIARAFATGPELVVLDEPLSALDVSSQASVVDLLTELRNRLDATYVFISHDLSLVRHFADRIGVMYLGRLVEVAPAGELFAAPKHPYTRMLLDAVPDLGSSGRARKPIEGEVPNPLDPPPGCAFHPRCRFATARCRAEQPQLIAADTAMVACHAVAEGRI
jgi:peptide/nickel transport system ATP-binding protein